MNKLHYNEKHKKNINNHKYVLYVHVCVINMIKVLNSYFSYRILSEYILVGEKIKFLLIKLERRGISLV